MRVWANNGDDHSRRGHLVLSQTLTRVAPMISFLDPESDFRGKRTESVEYTFIKGVKTTTKTLRVTEQRCCCHIHGPLRFLRHEWSQFLTALWLPFV